MPIAFRLFSQLIASGGGLVAFRGGSSTFISASTTGAGTWLRRALGVIGAASLLEWTISLMPDNESEAERTADFLDVMQSMLERGEIDIASPRRENPEEEPTVLKVDLSGNLNNGKPWLEYRNSSVNRKYIRTMKENQNTKWYRGQGGRRQSKNKTR